MRIPFKSEGLPKCEMDGCKKTAKYDAQVRFQGMKTRCWAYVCESCQKKYDGEGGRKTLLSTRKPGWKTKPTLVQEKAAAKPGKRVQVNQPGQKAAAKKSGG